MSNSTQEAHSPTRYPRFSWQKLTRIITAVVFGLGMAIYGGLVIDRAVDVSKTHRIQAENHLYEMIAGTADISSDGLGQLARVVRTLNTTPAGTTRSPGQVLEAYFDYHVVPGSFAGAADEINQNITDSSNAATFDQSFVIKAMEASDSTLLAQIEQVSQNPTTGNEDWRYLVGGLGLILSLGCLVSAAGAIDHAAWNMRRTRREKAAAVSAANDKHDAEVRVRLAATAGLPAEGTEAYLMLETLRSQSSTPPTSEELKLMKELSAFVDETRKGYGGDNLKLTLATQRLEELRVSAAAQREFFAQNE